MTNFNEWLDTFVEEKNIDIHDTFEIDKNGSFNIISYGAILDHIKATTKEEKAKIKNIIVHIDFKNGNVLDFFRHLGQALVERSEAQ
jgi:hypothetical protein